MNLRFYLTVLLRRLHYVVLFVVLGTACGVTIAQILPPRYVAEARLVVESQQIPNELAASTVRTETVEQLQIIRQRILSRDTLFALADQFNIYAAEDSGARSADQIVSDMRSRITISTSGGGRRGRPEATLVDVRFAAARPQIAAAVTNEIVTLILQENVEMRTTVSGQTLDFFDREVQRLDRELANRSAQIVAFQEANRNSLPESMEFRRSQLISAQQRKFEVERDLTQLKDRRSGLVEIYEQTGRLGVDAETAASPEARELQRLRDRYAANAVVMSEQNPRLQLLRAQIEALEISVSQQTGVSDGTEGVQGAYEAQLADIDNQIEFLERNSEQLDAEIAELRDSINATPNSAIQLQALMRDMDNVRAQYDRAVESRNRAETGDTIEALSKGQRISVIENATAPNQPNSPDRNKIMIAGFGGGLMAGLGLVVLLELLNASVRRSSEIEKALGISLIGSLSYMRTRGEIRRRRAMIIAAFAVAALGIPAALWAIDTYYTPISLIADSFIQKLPIIPDLLGRG